MKIYQHLNYQSLNKKRYPSFSEVECEKIENIESIEIEEFDPFDVTAGCDFDVDFQTIRDIVSQVASCDYFFGSKREFNRIPATIHRMRIPRWGIEEGTLVLAYLRRGQIGEVKCVRNGKI